MRFLILGGAGMLGHKLWQELGNRGETFVTLRSRFADYSEIGLFSENHTIDGCDVTQPQDLYRAFATARPTVVFNCVGIIKQLKQAHDPLISLTINSLLPHQLAALCAACGARLIHISTDCVFSGRKGSYLESDTPDPEDLYGRTKLLGETQAPNALTVRTSIIGREIRTRSGLLEWFLSQRGGTVRGFQRAIYTGFSTQALARVLADLATQHPEMTGLWQVSSDPINKFELLKLFDEAFACGTRVEPETAFLCDRSLDSARFRAATGFRPPSWPEMVREMSLDPTPYDSWRRGPH